jgi:hypothetical protein
LREDSGRVAIRSDVPVPDVSDDLETNDVVTLDQAVEYGLASID